MTRLIDAWLMRGGTSRGVFLRGDALPTHAVERDALVLRAMGSPDPYRRQIDGLGGATSSTSKVVLLWPSGRPDADVEYLFGQVSVDQPLIDWSGNCGNLMSAVGPYALHQGWVAHAPRDGMARVRIFNRNRAERIEAEVLMQAGEVCETGDFREDGVAFDGSPIALTVASDESLPVLPTGQAVDQLSLPDGRLIEATLIRAGNPTVFIRAADLGLSGLETPGEFKPSAVLAQALEHLRAQAAVRMGLAQTPEQASREQPAIPKIAWLAPAQAYTATDGRSVATGQVDLCARILSMGVLHASFTGTGSIALATAAAIPGTLAHGLHGLAPDALLRIGHPAGVLPVGARVSRVSDGAWLLQQARLVRTARRLMLGQVVLP